MESDFEQQRRERESARRREASARDVERRSALAAGARAPSVADNASAEGASRVIMVGAAGVAALLVPVALLTGGTLVSAAALCGAFAFATITFVAHRFAQKRELASRDGSSRPVGLGGSLSSASRWEISHARARETISTSGLDEARKFETLASLRSAADEIRELNRKRLAVGGKELAVQADERIAGFVANCQEIVVALEDQARTEVGSAGGSLDQIAGHLAAEAEARAELEEALRRASTQRVPTS